MRRDWLVTALCLLALVVSVQAIAEVRVITDRNGAYETTRVLLDERGSGVWGALYRGRPKKHSLPVKSVP